MRQNLSLVIALGLVAVLSAPAFSADLSDAEATVDNIREADPPSVSTTTKESPVGQPISDYKPTGPSVNAKEPPSPTKPYNPQNDPHVQRGWDDNQRRNGR